MNVVKRLYVVTSLGVIGFATFQFLQIIGLFSILNLQNQFTLQFQIKPWLFLLFGILQCALLLIIGRNYLWLKKYNHKEANIKLRAEKNARWRSLRSSEHAKNVTDLFSIYYRLNDGSNWNDIFPKPQPASWHRDGRQRFAADNSMSKVFAWPFTYRYKERLSYHENISKVKSRYYLCLGITVLSPVYQVVINLAYLLGLSARTMEWLWQYPRFFSVFFLIDIILTGNMLRQTSGNSIL